MVLVTRNKLIWIRVLIVISQLLLIALISNWLISQYREQRTQLQKQLEEVLAAAQETVSDSLITKNIIDPVLQNAERDIDNTMTVKDDPGGNGKTSVKIVIAGDKIDNKKLAELQAALSHASTASHTKSTDTILSVSLKEQDSTKIFFEKHNLKTEKGELKPFLNLVVKKAMQQDQKGSRDLILIDTGVFKRAFYNKMHKTQWTDFSSVWSPEKKTEGLLLVNNTFLGQPYTVGIGDYSFYLIKKISPQLLFSVLLLCITSVAFFISFKTIREQQKLAALRNDLISNMSHELKTPITTIKIALEALDKFDRIADKETTREYLEIASSEIARLDLLAGQAMNTAMLQQGRMQLQKDVVDLKKLINELLRAMQPRFQQNNADVSFDSEGNNFFASLDKLHFQGVLINLLDNSMKYATDKPRINIKLIEKAHDLVITVTDNGPGIPPEYLKSVFEKFFRVPSGDRHNVKGYGLGLSYAKEVVVLHGGSINADNIDAGGCAMTILVPKYDA